MKKVKAIFEAEIYRLLYLNNKPVMLEYWIPAYFAELTPEQDEPEPATFTQYQELVDYCADNNLDLVRSSGL